jgi:hypothetical protein
MATKKSTTVTINAPEFEVIKFKIVGDTPLIVHAWDEKAKRMMLDKQMGKAAKTKHEIKVPVNDFINSLYWLTEKPENGIDDADAQRNFDEAIENGARFGFSIGGIKQSFITGASRGGLDVKMTELRGAFFLEGDTDASNFDFAEIVGPAPVMREDMVKVGGMSKTADIRYRGEFKKWEIPLRMRFNKNGKYSAEQLLSCVTVGGFVTGIGEWRPERDGQFGMFHMEI